MVIGQIDIVECPASCTEEKCITLILYPWLAPDDPRRFQTDNQILYEKIDLSELDLTSKEKTKLKKLIVRYRDAFSLRDEIGACPNLTADIQVIDESSFFVRPFCIK